MPRDSSGNCTQVAGNPVVTNTPIATLWGNNSMADIYAILQDSLSRTGLGGMQAPLQLYDGVVATPGLSFALEPSTGLYRVSAGKLGVSALGVQYMTFDATNGVFISSLANYGGIFLQGTQSNVAIRLNNTTVTTGKDWRISSDSTGRLSFLIGTSFQAGIGPTGGLVMGAPTGGDKGIGTVNCTQIYVNGAALSGGVTTVSGTANQIVSSGGANPTLTLASAGIVIPGGTTGGSKGAGTLNAAGLYVNGAAVLPQIPSNYSAIKPADTVRSSTNVPADDPDLVFTGLPLGKYTIDALLRISCTTTAAQGFRYQFNGDVADPQSQLLTLMDVTGSLAMSSVRDCYAGDNFPVTAAGTVYTIHAKGVITVILAGGKVAVQWAQQSSSANSTKLLAGSYFTLNRAG